MTEHPRFDVPITPPERVTGWAGDRATPGGGPDLPVFYPASGQQISVLVEDDADAVDVAVTTARRAFDTGPWPGLSTAERTAVLERCGQVIRDHADELARLECAATGLLLRELRERHMVRAAYNFRFFADYISQRAGERYDQTPGYLTTVVREPVGVAALIAPWNAPVALATMKIAAALSFGNTCVLKPSEQTPLALARLVELLQDVLPEGVLNLVNGRGPVTGAALVAHPGVDLVSFTGGTETGRAIMSTAGQRLVPCTMELGGKSANVIFANADLDRALDGALLGIFSNNGQQCLAGSRILVERSIFDDFVGRFIDRAQQIRVGDPTLAETELGPLASHPHMMRVLGFVDTARADGGALLTGGVRRDDLGEGYFVAPTAVTVPGNDARTAQDEIFGPFATFLPFDTVEDAATIANDTQFGLVSYVWSDHLPTVMTMTERLRSGVVWVNTPMMRELRAPFGGYKNSGVGREGGAACEAFYTEEKTVTLPKTPPPLRRLGDTGG
ncbi:aldehyde dehydrogenase [Marivita hallyeonensis]|uniref:5-carboxymethyl-2-hydroxymuconic-semialdehyde dehydrogenase n=1 Tax=Marivita hallyeonensis TaxID=996342 RepID=A0A1M5LU45_9RHOB|nr:aldehyde dehydrogenase [Marivita hallyeonensis]SHG67913.1 5-carboxymethyl-2-hydroxymuconic-semialdehyde dehydrogenase [Marivita hallyeonensis]